MGFLPECTQKPQWDTETNILWLTQQHYPLELKEHLHLLIKYCMLAIGWQMTIWSWKRWWGFECLRVQFCTVCVLTAGRGKKINLAETCSPQKKAVNNRNSIKLPRFPVSYALWTAWSDRVWLAERLVGCWSAPTAAPRTLSWLRRTALICTSSEWGFILYLTGLKKKKMCPTLQSFAKESTEPQVSFT